MRANHAKRYATTEDKPVPSTLRVVATIIALATTGIVPVMLFLSWDIVRYDTPLPKSVTDNFIWYPLVKGDYFKKAPIQMFNHTPAQVVTLDASNLPHAWLGVHIFFPALARLYIGKEFPFKHALKLIFLVCVSKLVLFWYGFEELRKVLVLVGPSITYFLLQRYLPDDTTGLAKQILGHVAILLIGVGAVIFARPLFPESDPIATMFRFCVFYPAVRELIRYAASKSAWFLSQKKDKNETSWVFLVYAQIFFAYFLRLEIANLTNTYMLWFTVFYQLILEVTMRLTVEWRDRVIRTWEKKLWRVARRQGNRVHSTFTVPDFSTAELSQKTDEALKVAEQRLAFQAKGIATEMMSEYTAIFAATMTLVAYSRKILLSPFPWYAGMDAPFDEYPRLIDMAKWGILQFFMEVGADSLSVYYEMKNGFPIWQVIQQFKNSAFVGRYMLASWYGFIMTFSAITSFRDNFDACWGMDMCFCVGKGLSAGGLLEMYCHTIYNETQGIPPVLNETQPIP